MFLKNNLGTGYVMRIACDGAIDDPSPILREVQGVIPNATVKECKGQELAVALPKEDLRLFPDAIRHMDGLAAERTHGVVSISMAVSTLEDVYMRIVTQSERAAAAATSEHDAEMTANLQQLFANTGVLPEEVTLKAALQRQIPAMFMKRFHYARRNRCALFIQVIAPLISIFIAMFMTYVNLNNTPSVTFDSDLLAPIPQVMTTSNCQNLSPYWSSEYSNVDDRHTIRNTRDFATYLGATYNDQGDNERTVSYMCDDNNGDTIIFANSTNYASAPIGLQELYRARVRQATVGQADVNPTITTTYRPLASSVADEAQVEGLQALLMAVFIMIPFTFIPSTYVAYIVREREVRSKQLQFVSGANYIAYWVGNFLFDITSYCVTMIIAFTLFGIFQRKEYIGTAAAGFAVLFLFILYGLSGIGSAYFVSYYFKNHSTGQTVVLLGNFIIGFVLVVMIFFMRNISSTIGTADVLVYFFRIVPSFCVGEGLMNIATAYTLKDLYESNPFDMGVAGWDMLYMGIESVVFFTMAAFIDHPSRARKQQMLTFNSEEEAPIIEDEDEDVLKERLATETGHREDDIVLVKGLRKVFGGGVMEEQKVAVQNLSFGVHTGEVFGFLGTNGAGKTTTMSMLTTDIVPTCGRGMIGGFDVVQEAGETRRLIGYCPQFDAVIDLLTPDEHMHLFAALRNIPKDQVQMVVDALINACALDNYRDIPAGRLSGGNRRKLSVAMALIGGPSIVFLDEPSAGMDPHARRQMWDVVSLVAKLSSVVLTTHHLEEVDVLAHRVGIMDQGLMKCLGSLEHLKHKFGNGYELTIQVADFESAERALVYVSEALPAAVLVEARQTRMLFALPSEYTDIASMFETLQRALEDTEIGIVDFTLQQTSLEQVFMRIAELSDQRAHDEGIPLDDARSPQSALTAYSNDPCAASFATTAKAVANRDAAVMSVIHEQSMIASAALYQPASNLPFSEDGVGECGSPKLARFRRQQQGLMSVGFNSIGRSRADASFSPDFGTEEANPAGLSQGHNALPSTSVSARATSATSRYMFAVANGSRMYEINRSNMTSSRAYIGPAPTTRGGDNGGGGQQQYVSNQGMSTDFPEGMPHASAQRRN